MVPHPTGTVTFLFTDIERSTRMWDEHSSDMRVALQRHDEILRAVIERHHGFVFSTAGDAFSASFGRAQDAVEAAMEAQRALGAESWPEPTPVRVRMGLHTGEAEERDGDYFGPAVNRAARVASAAHGGQVVLTSTTAGVVGPAGLVDLGEHRLKDLSVLERVWQIGPGTFPPLRSLEPVRNNLPVQRNELFGRADEVERVAGLVEASRLVTLTGIGGAGKTRLAVATAVRLTQVFPLGVFFIDLSPLADGRLVAVAVGEATGVSLDASATGTGSMIRQLAKVLSERRLLLVIDNCEHLIDDVAELIEGLLSAGQELRILATSREALQVDGERAFNVPSLAAVVDGVDGPALRLLLDRARAADDRFEARVSDRNALIGICERLDGIPLAIVLAAVHLRHMSPGELLGQLDDRFRMLVGGRHRRRQRQQTLQATMDWSWGLLDDDERRVLAELSVFSGGWTLDAAQGVCAGEGRPVTELIGSLVAKSLVIADQNRWGSRYVLLETVRMYAQFRLSEREDAHRLRTRQAEWFASWANRWSFEDQWASAELASRLRADFDNLRSAVDWLTDDGANDALASLVMACTFLWREDFAPREALQWTGLVDIEMLSAERRGRMILACADAAYVNGDYDSMRLLAGRAYDEAVKYGADAVAAAALTVMSRGLTITDPERATLLLEEAVARARAVGANRVEATALALLAFVGGISGTALADRVALVDRARLICGPDGWDHNYTHMQLAWLQLELGQPNAALATNQRIAESAETIGLPLEAARAWLEVAWTAAETGHQSAWSGATRTAYRRYLDAGSDRGLPDVLLSIALWEALHGDPTRASQLLATVATGQLNDQTGYWIYGRCREHIRAASLPSATVAAARMTGGNATIRSVLDDELRRLDRSPARPPD